MHVGDKFGDLYRVPSDPVAGLMESQDLIAIETMLQQCLQSIRGLEFQGYGLGCCPIERVMEFVLYPLAVSSQVCPESDRFP